MKHVLLEDLKSAIKKMDAVIARNNTLVVLDNVLFDKGKMVGSDLEVTLEVGVKSIDFKALVDFRVLKKIVSKWGTGKVTFKIETDTVQRKGKPVKKRFVVISKVGTKSKFRLGEGCEVGEFVKYGKGISKRDGVFKKDDIDTIIRGLGYVGNDELRPVMGGVYIDKKNIVATDAHRLMYPEKVAKTKHQYIIPTKVVKLLKVGKYEKITAKVDKDCINAMFTDGKDKIFFRTIDGRYPNWEAIIPRKATTKISFDREQIKALLNEIDMCELAANKTTHQMRFEKTRGKVSVAAFDPDFDNEYHSVISASAKGSNIAIGFNSRFLRGIVKDIDQANGIEMKMSEPNKAVICNDETLLMPVMLND